ncbi:hypothetical protein Tco_1097683 [Tanacetum coccineum]
MHVNSNDQDSLNSAAGGNFLDKMPRDCLRIIESKSKVRNSRNKPVVAKVSSSSSTPSISPDVAELKDMVKALLLDKKNQPQAPAPVKVVEESCVTCGSAANFNQGNTGYRAPIANQIRPPGFPPVQQNQGNNQNRYNQNRGNNYNQSQIYRPPINQPPVHQAQPYQAPAPQTQGVTKNDFESYVKANDAVMRNMQDQNQNLQNQMTNLTDMLSKFVNSNTASTSGSGTLPSNTITNPKVDLKGITTRSGVAYQGPTIPTTSSSPPKVVACETEYPIVDWKTYTLSENFMYYKIIRGDGSSKNYKILSEMLYDFDRQDIVELYRLVKERYSSSKPEGYDLMLWGDLHTLFEPDEESEIWMNQNEYNLISWSLCDFCGVHILLMQNGIAIHMLTEKKYPLSQEMISKMLSKRLEVDQESTQAYELLKFIRSQVKK